MIPKASKNVQNRSKKRLIFIDLLSHFGFILGSFFHVFWFQKYIRIGKGDFMKMSFSCTRGAHFQGFWLPSSIQTSMKKRSKNETLFSTVFGSFGAPFCDHFWIKIASKNRSKNQCDFGSIFERFSAHPGVHVASPSRSGMPPGRPQDAPRRSQDAPKMLPRRARTPANRAPQEAPRGPNTPPSSILDDFSLNFHRFFIDFFIDSSWIFHGFFIDVLICWDYSGSTLGVFWKY